MPLNDAYHVGLFNFMEKNIEQNAEVKSLFPL